uniref:Uncharacterized protein n=1 Tax=Nyssomyia neivai TaxID=330878 RepID=A0A1L8D824_9DIPT
MPKNVRSPWCSTNLCASCVTLHFQLPNEGQFGKIQGGPFFAIFTFIQHYTQIHNISPQQMLYLPSFHPFTHRFCQIFPLVYVNLHPGEVFRGVFGGNSVFFGGKIPKMS